MSNTDHSPTPKNAGYRAAREARVSQNPAAGGLQGAAGAPAHLQYIHELVRSGDYHIPAAEIADRMIERIIVDKQGRQS